jgi:hypothetical protein
MALMRVMAFILPVDRRIRVSESPGDEREHPPEARVEELPPSLAARPSCVSILIQCRALPAGTTR